MNLSDDVDLEDFVARPDKISGADIHSICQEAGKNNRISKDILHIICGISYAPYYMGLIELPFSKKIF